MLRVELPALIEKLSPVCKLVLQDAASICISRQNKEVAILHFLTALIASPLCDFRIMLQQIGIDHELLQKNVNQYLPQEKSVEAYPVFSPLLIELLQEAWLLSSTELQQNNIRSGVIFLTILLQDERYLPYELVGIFKKVNRENYRTNFAYLLNESSEAPINTTQMPVQALSTANTNIEKYTTNFTKLAKQGELDPVLSRDDEINLMIDILCRRRKNNPIVVGDAGVGKSALIEGLAQKIVNQQVPEKLFDVVLLCLDLGLLQAGASVKGEFEKRLKGIIDEVKASPTPIILFIDEAHTLIGAGNQEGGGDAANLLKPALARGDLRMIAATTWKEYKKYFEKDPALTRRFQLVKLNEPTIKQTTDILRGLHHVYEDAHQVLITDGALKAAAQLSARYISGRQLPDKAIDVLDTACARIAINLHVPPAELTRLIDMQYQLELERNLIERQVKVGGSIDENRLEELLIELQDSKQRYELIKTEWDRQKSLIKDIILLRTKILQLPDLILSNHDEVSGCNTEQAESDVRISLISELKAKETKLLEMGHNALLVHSLVDERQIAAVISDWTGVPVNQMDSDELVKITLLPDYLRTAIKGQDLAIHKIHQHMLTSRADLRKSGRPKGAFLLVGPSGVGKTETVLQIAEQLYGGKQFLTTINMSEYQEKHTVSRLIGSPPGYVGYGEGGILTESIRQKPYSIVLLDETEKAHPEVLNIFYQAFDKGELADGEGRLIDCQNIVFFLTSNLGYQTIVDYYDSPTELEEKLYPELANFFKPALLARMEVIPYMPLSDSVLEEIIRYKLSALEHLLQSRYQATVVFEDLLINEIQTRATRSENGARMLESIIDGQLLPPLSLLILNRMARNESINRINLFVENKEFKCHVD